MASPWIEHVKKVAAEQGISYKEALKIASKTYKKAPPKKGGMAQQEGQGLIEDVVKTTSKVIDDQIKNFQNTKKNSDRAGRMLHSGQFLPAVGEIIKANPSYVFGKSLYESPLVMGQVNKELEKRLKRGKGAPKPDQLGPSKVALHLRPKPMYQNSTILDLSKGGIKTKA